ncbi:MAG: hypothetical protein R3C53_07360 [Pirellulaceae bacterium]
MRTLFTLCFLTLVGLRASSAQQLPDNQVIELRLQAGAADSGELFQAVAKDLHWIAGSVAGFTRVLGTESELRQSIPPNQVAELVQQFPSVFAYRYSASGEPVALTVDSQALAELLEDKKSRFRSWLAGVQKVDLSRIERVTDTWRDADADVSPPRIVVTLSGIHGMAESSRAVALQLHAQTNLPMCVFRYPNDAAMTESSSRLVRALEQLHNEFPRSKISLVAHSFGGLVARHALEMHDAIDHQRRSSVAERTGVDQLIQVCPPNHGSALSDYAPLLEGVEQVSRLMSRGDQESRLLLRMIHDGFNEASLDLDPRSPDVLAMNAGKRNSQVRYSVLAGNDGPLKPTASSLLDIAWSTIAEATDEPAELDRRVRDVIHCPELQKGSGDGVVALSSARLAGIDDFEVLDIHHLTWSQLDKPAGQQLIEAIACRLGISL